MESTGSLVLNGLAIARPRVVSVLQAERVAYPLKRGPVESVDAMGEADHGWLKVSGSPLDEL